MYLILTGIYSIHTTGIDMYWVSIVHVLNINMHQYILNTYQKTDCTTIHIHKEETYYIYCNIV